MITRSQVKNTKKNTISQGTQTTWTIEKNLPNHTFDYILCMSSGGKRKIDQIINNSSSIEEKLSKNRKTDKDDDNFESPVNNTNENTTDTTQNSKKITMNEKEDNVYESSSDEDYIPTEEDEEETDSDQDSDDENSNSESESDTSSIEDDSDTYNSDDYDDIPIRKSKSNSIIIPLSLDILEHINKPSLSRKQTNKKDSVVEIDDDSIDINEIVKDTCESRKNKKHKSIDDVISNYEKIFEKALKSNKSKNKLLKPNNDDHEHCEKETEDCINDEYCEKSVRKYMRSLDDEEKQFFKKLNKNEQQSIVNVEKNIMSINRTEIPLRFKIIQSDLDTHTKAIAIRNIDLLSQMDENTSEYYKITNWIDSLCKIPIGKYTKLKVDHSSSAKEISDFIVNTKNQFDKNIYGHENAKDQIIRILAQWISNPKSKGNVIGIHGSPGVGKTTLVKDCICTALNLPFAFIPLGGASDGSYLDGHGYTYEGSTWGKIVDVLMKNNCMNPVLYFDELDKVSDTYKGNEIINILIHLTDSSQNNSFNDKYFNDIKFDLSKCLIVFTYNDDNAINPILKDRMIRLSTKDYNTQDKLNIAKYHLIPDMMEQFNFEKTDVIFNDDVISYIIEKTDKEAGVRNLKRSFELILSHVNLYRFLNNNESNKIFEKKNTDWFKSFKLPLTITSTIVDNYLKDSVVNESLTHLYT